MVVWWWEWDRKGETVTRKRKGSCWREVLEQTRGEDVCCTNAESTTLPCDPKASSNPKLPSQALSHSLLISHTHWFERHHHPIPEWASTFLFLDLCLWYFLHQACLPGHGTSNSHLPSSAKGCLPCQVFPHHPKETGLLPQPPGSSSSVPSQFPCPPWAAVFPPSLDRSYPREQCPHLPTLHHHHHPCRHVLRALYGQHGAKSAISFNKIHIGFYKRAEWLGIAGLSHRDRMIPMGFGWPRLGLFSAAGFGLWPHDSPPLPWPRPGVMFNKPSSFDGQRDLERSIWPQDAWLHTCNLLHLLSVALL